MAAIHPIVAKPAQRVCLDLRRLYRGDHPDTSVRTCVLRHALSIGSADGFLRMAGKTHGKTPETTLPPWPDLVENPSGADLHHRFVSRHHPTHRLTRALQPLWKNHRRHPAATARNDQPLDLRHRCNPSSGCFTSRLDLRLHRIRIVSPSDHHRRLSRPPMVQHSLPGRCSPRVFLEICTVPTKNRQFRMRRVLDVRTRLPGPVHRFQEPQNRSFPLHHVPQLCDILQTQRNFPKMLS